MTNEQIKLVQDSFRQIGASWQAVATQVTKISKPLSYNEIQVLVRYSRSSRATCKIDQPGFFHVD